MNTFKGLSLTAFICLSLTGCASLMDSSTPAPIDTMSTSGTPVTTSTSTTTTVNKTSSLSGSISGEVGKVMNDADAVKVNQTLEANKTGQTTSWIDTSSNTTFAVTPTRTFASPTGEPCRDFTTTATTNGQSNQAYGTACRDSNGQWHVISS